MLKGVVWLACSLLVLRFVLAIFSPGTPDTQWLFSTLGPAVSFIQGLTNLLMLPLFMVWGVIHPLFPASVDLVFPVASAAAVVGGANHLLGFIPGLAGSPLEGMVLQHNFQQRYPGQLEWLALLSIPFWMTIQVIVDGIIGLLREVINSWFSVAQGEAAPSGLSQQPNPAQQRGNLPANRVQALRSPSSSQGVLPARETASGSMIMPETRQFSPQAPAQAAPLYVPTPYSMDSPSSYSPNLPQHPRGQQEPDLRMKQLLNSLKEENRQLQLKQQDLRSTFSSFFSPAVLQYLEEYPEVLNVQSNHSQKVSVLFCDIRNFTQYSQNHTSQQVSEYLAQFFDIVNRVILQKFDGTINKLIGDSVLAYWNFPMPIPNHALLATQAGLEILKTLDQYNRQPGVDPLQVGIGVSTGLVSVGNVGSKEFKDFTIIGAPVNIASRLQETNKVLNSQLLIDVETYLALNQQVYCQDMGLIPLRGIEESQQLYQPLG